MFRLRSLLLLALLTRNVSFQLQILYERIVSGSTYTTCGKYTNRRDLHGGKGGTDSFTLGFMKSFDFKCVFMPTSRDNVNELCYDMYLFAAFLKPEDRSFSRKIIDNLKNLNLFSGTDIDDLGADWKEYRDSNKENFKLPTNNCTSEQNQKNPASILNRVGLFFRRRFLNLWDRNPNTFGGISFESGMYADPTTAGSLKVSISSPNMSSYARGNEKTGILSKIRNFPELKIGRSKGNLYEYDDWQLRVFMQKIQRLKQS